MNGTCDFQFSLYDAASGGSQVGSTQTAGNVTVSNGYFSVDLDLGSSAFQGDARYLQIAVRCPAGSGSYTTLSGRVALTATPYALALPGLWTLQNSTSPNLIGGYSGNTVPPGVYGATIGGGGENGSTNRVTDNYGTVGGGYNNRAGDNAGGTDDAHVHAAEGLRSDGVIEKTGGPLQASVYSDTLMFTCKVWDEYDARNFEDEYDPFLKSWGYYDLVWTTYAGGREAKQLFSTVLWPGDRAIVRVALDNNTGITLTHLNVTLTAVPGLTITHLYTDPATAPEPIWPELAFLNRPDAPNAWRSVWYFEIQAGDVAEDLWGAVLEIPVIATADNFPTNQPYNEVPPARIALYRPGAATPTYISGPAHGLILTDTLPANVVLTAAAWTTDATVVNAVQMALDVDAGELTQDTASLVYASLVPTRATPLLYTVNAAGRVTFTLPAEVQALPLDAPLYVIAPATLIRAQHGPNVVNAGAGIAYRDPFEVEWTAQSQPVIVDAHGAVVWVEYECNGGGPPARLLADSPVYVVNRTCYIPDDGPSDVQMRVTAYNAGDAIAGAVTVTLTLLDWVTATTAWPAWAARAGQQITWTLGDFAPGQARQLDITFHVEPVESGDDEAGDAAPIRDLLGIRRSDGVFFDDYSRQTISGQVGEAFWFKVYAVERVTAIYLPVVTRGYRAPISIPWPVGVTIPPRPPAYQGEAFYRVTLAIPATLPDGGHFYLSSRRDAVAEIVVDDALAIVDENAQDAFYYQFSQDGDPPSAPVAAIVEIPRATMAELAGQTVTLEYRDVFGSLVEATEVWLIPIP